MSDDKEVKEETENDVPSKKRRKQNDHAVNLCPIINPVNKVIFNIKIRHISTNINGDCIT